MTLSIAYESTHANNIHINILTHLFYDDLVNADEILIGDHGMGMSVIVIAATTSDGNRFLSNINDFLA